MDFHNTRDNGVWPAPEVGQNINTTDVGNMGLTEAEVDDILAFLMTFDCPDSGALEMFTQKGGK